MALMLPPYVAIPLYIANGIGAVVFVAFVPSGEFGVAASAVMGWFVALCNYMAAR